MLSHRFGTQEQLLRAENNSPPLGKGHQGLGVAQIQNLLRDLRFTLVRSFSRGKADGIFGLETENAVKAFQRANGLKADGIVGRKTIGRMDTILIEKPFLDTVPADSPRRGSEPTARRFVTSRRTS
jgi:peptidoglycan hydrolase-like protein with peptidoglycan-binding domain